MSNDNGSNQPTKFPLWRRLAIVACMSLGAIFAVRAATSPATATSSIQPNVETTPSEEMQARVTVKGGDCKGGDCKGGDCKGR